MKRTGKKILSLLLTLVMLLGLLPGMTLMAYAEGEEITSDIQLIATGIGCKDFDSEAYGDGDKKVYTVKEGVKVVFACLKGATRGPVTIYLNGTVVKEWPAGSVRNDGGSYRWTAKKDAKIDFSNLNEKIYLTQNYAVTFKPGDSTGDDQPLPAHRVMLTNTPRLFSVQIFRFRHCEPARTLVWQSVLPAASRNFCAR